MIITETVGPLESNCYILANGGSCVVVDPGFEDDRIIARIESEGLRVKAVVLTHSHYDHIGSAKEVAKHYNVPIYIHKDGIESLLDADKNLSSFFGEPVVIDDAITIEDGEIIEVDDDLTFRVIHTPGHSKCSISLYTDKILISGDTLFDCGFGRYDLPGSDVEQLRKSLKNLLKLPDDTIVYPGHGDITTIAQAKRDLKSFLQ